MAPSASRRWVASPFRKARSVQWAAMPSMNFTKPGASEGLMYSGLSGFSIHRRDWRTTPGAGTGPLSARAILAALPWEAACPASRASRTTTSQPLPARRYAPAKPTTPAPTTMMRMESCPS